MIIQWPSAIPLPFVDFSGSVRNTTLQSMNDAGLIARRSRFSTAYCGVVVAWILDAVGYESFQAFYHIALSEGTSLFSLPVRYPKNSELTTWVVRFFGGYEAQYEDGHWVLRADLDLVRKAPTEDPPPPIGPDGFLVVDESATGAFQEFILSGGNPFYVET